MAETYTSNLELVKPDYDSPADIFVINSNMDKIDNAVANAGKVKSVNGKTGEVDLTASDVGALPAGSTAKNSAKLGGKAPEYYIQPIELLDNPEFAIAQAGYGGYHGNTMYAADRWFVEHGESAITVERSNGVTTISTSASGLAMVAQKLSDGAMLRMPNGTPVTLAVCGKDGDIKTTTFIYEEPAVVGKVFDSTVIAAGMQVNLFQDLSNERPRVRIYTDEITTVAFKWIRLIPGTYTADTLPPYVPKGYAAELAECQRYYRFYSTLILSKAADNDQWYGVNGATFDMVNNPSAVIVGSVLNVASLPLEVAVTAYIATRQDFSMIGLSKEEPSAFQIRNVQIIADL